MKTRCALIQACFLVLLALPVTVQAQFTFVTNNGAITITSYIGGSSAAVNIPSTTNGYPVVSIGDSAFANRSTVTGVIIPNSITNIGNSVFSACGLRNVTVPDSVIGMGTNVFYSSGLTNALIGNNVNNIGSLTFFGCNGLGSVNTN